MTKIVTSKYFRDNFSGGQRRTLSDILGNLGVAWFSAGVIAPIFLGQLNFPTGVIPFAVGTGMAVSFVVVAVVISQKLKS